MEKGTEAFNKSIKKELDMRAFKNPLFREHYMNPEKNIEKCCEYILSEVQKSGRNGFTDDEIYSMAVHYYTEKDVVAKGTFTGKVVVNHHVQLTASEIEEAKKEARQKVIDEEIEKLRPKKTKAVETSSSGNTLFE